MDNHNPVFLLNICSSFVGENYLDTTSPKQNYLSKILAT